jgi:hypothetical protein
MRRAEAALALAASVVLPSPDAVAQPVPETDRVVDVVIAAPPEPAASLEAALREPMDRLGLRLRWFRVDWFELAQVFAPDPDAPPAVARVWFDLVGVSARARGAPLDAQATMYVVDGPWARVLVRDVPLETGFDEVVREELAAILLSSVEGILNGAPLGRPREEVREELGVEASPPRPTSTSTTTSTTAVTDTPTEPRASASGQTPTTTTTGDLLVLELGLGYEPSGFADDVGAVHGLGLSLALGARRGFARGGGWLTGEYRLPVEEDGNQGVGVRLDVGALRLLAVVELAFTDRFALQLAAGGGVDIVRVEPRRTGAVDVQLEPVSHAARGIIQLLLGVRLVISRPFSLWLGVGVDVDPAQVRYVVQVPDGTAVVLVPWLVRPFGMLRLCFDVLGGGPGRRD